jgi:hypothetical protein
MLIDSNRCSVSIGKLLLKPAEGWRKGLEEAGLGWRGDEECSLQSALVDALRLARRLRSTQ